MLLGGGAATACGRTIPKTNPECLFVTTVSEFVETSIDFLFYAGAGSVIPVLCKALSPWSISTTSEILALEMPLSTIVAANRVPGLPFFCRRTLFLHLLVIPVLEVSSALIDVAALAGIVLGAGLVTISVGHLLYPEK